MTSRMLCMQRRLLLAVATTTIFDACTCHREQTCFMVEDWSRLTIRQCTSIPRLTKVCRCPEELSHSNLRKMPYCLRRLINSGSIGDVGLYGRRPTPNLGAGTRSGSDGGIQRGLLRGGLHTITDSLGSNSKLARNLLSYRRFRRG
jgi:hypothetical protein